MSSTDMTRLALLRARRAAKLPSEEDKGKPSYDADFKAGFAAGKAAYAKNDKVSKADADKAYKRVSNKHGSWWVEGYTAAIDLARGAYATKGAQIAKKMKLSSVRTAADDEKWFKGEIEKALQILQDACDVADQRGGLSDNNGKVAAAVADIRKKISRDLDKHVKAIR